VAKAPAAAPKGEPKAKSGISLMAILIVTLICGGGGAFFGMQIPKIVEIGDPNAKKVEAHKADPHAKKISIRNLAPITTSLAAPANTWIRLETAVLVVEQLGPDADALLGKLAEDVIAYLRTVPLEQIEGPSGFQHMREDLNDRVRIRSEGKVTEVMIQAFVVE
jgi:flagellar FliL protein